MPQVVVNCERCKSCGLCVHVCPRKVLAIGDRPNAKGYYAVCVKQPEDCLGCRFCGLMCPDIALEIYK